MAVSKDVLNQYYDLKQEEVEVKRSIDLLRDRIALTEEQLSYLHHNTVKDKVYGGFGGEQGFVIEGYDERDIAILRARLLRDKKRLMERLQIKEDLKDRISEQIVNVEQFMYDITDSQVRRIVYFRFVEHLSWNRVADKMGGGNTEDSVRKTLDRYLEKL